jgi:hypothetical protein
MIRSKIYPSKYLGSSFVFTEDNLCNILLQQHVIKWYALCAKCGDDEISVVEMGGAFVMHEKE